MITGALDSLSRSQKQQAHGSDALLLSLDLCSCAVWEPGVLLTLLLQHSDYRQAHTVLPSILCGCQGWHSGSHSGIV